jgi:hypothetical protein
MQVVLRGENIVEFNGKPVKPQTREYLRNIAKVRASASKVACGTDGAENHQETNRSRPSQTLSMARVEEKRPHVSSRVAQLRIPSPCSKVVSFNSQKGLPSVCTPPGACTVEELRDAAWARR